MSYCINISILLTLISDLILGLMSDTSTQVHSVPVLVLELPCPAYLSIFLTPNAPNSKDKNVQVLLQDALLYSILFYVCSFYEFSACLIETSKEESILKNHILPYFCHFSALCGQQVEHLSI